MRGKAAYAGEVCLAARITPAYAGKSAHFGGGGAAYKDHPRLCGEKGRRLFLVLLHMGSPPPMRGKAFSTIRPNPSLRITPAYAGKRQIFWA